MPPNSAAVAAAACHSFDHISEAAAYSPAAALAARSSRETRRVAPFGFRWTAPPLLLWLLLSWLLLLLSSQSENSDKSKTVQPPTSKVRYITGIDVSYGLGSMEDPRKKPEPDMEIAKAYRSIIMGPQRGNLGRGACFWDSDGKIGNYNRSRFSLVEVFTETSTHAPLQLFLMDCHILHIISCCGTLLLLYVYSHGCAHQASKRSR